MIKSVVELPAQGKQVFVRIDFNVPLEHGKVLDDRRIKTALPTVNLLIRNGADKIRLATHLGRPTQASQELSTKLLQPTLQSLFKENYHKIELLENLRFSPLEEGNDRSFAAELVDGMDYYVNEAFSNSHRAHASMVAAAQLKPAFGGLALLKEVSELTKLRSAPERPFVVVIGGAKVTDKLPLVQALLPIADKILVGGKVGFELTDDHPKIVKPLDSVSGFDIGPKTRHRFSEELAAAKTIFWNGNLGKSEELRYAAGTQELARYIASLPAYRVVGGGDTVAAVEALGLTNSFDFVSTGGGATLEFLAGKRLPGLEALGYYE